jgi:hypothetical protein
MRKFGGGKLNELDYDCVGIGLYILGIRDLEKKCHES